MTVQWEIRQVSAAEDLYNRAMSVLYAYQNYPLGRRQKEALVRLAYLSPIQEQSCTLHKDRVVLETLKSRGLVLSVPTNHPELKVGWNEWGIWFLTPLGHQVVTIMEEGPLDW